MDKSTISMPIFNSFNGMFTRPGIPFRPAMKKGYPHGITPEGTPTKSRHTFPFEHGEKSYRPWIERRWKMVETREQ